MPAQYRVWPGIQARCLRLWRAARPGRPGGCNPRSREDLRAHVKNDYLFEADDDFVLAQVGAQCWLVACDGRVIAGALLSSIRAAIEYACDCREQRAAAFPHAHPCNCGLTRRRARRGAETQRRDRRGRARNLGGVFRLNAPGAGSTIRSSETLCSARGQCRAAR